jgi:hypothetical protein
VDKVGGLDTQVGPPLDLDLELRIAINFPIVISKKPCSIFLMHNSSCSGSLNLSYFWPGWAKMMQNVSANTNLSPSLKKQIDKLLIKDFCRHIFNIMHKAICDKKFSEVQLCTAVLKESYGLPLKGLLMSMIAKLCEKSDLVSNVVFAMRNIKKSLKKSKKASENEPLEAEFGHYKKWLET